MKRRFHPRMLFEKWRHDPRRRHPYPSDVSELDAIRAGKKGMSMFGSTIAELGQPDMADLIRLAFDRGLVVVFQGEPLASPRLDHAPARVLVARPEELWRVPAYTALWETVFETGSRWSDAAEAHQGLLLGYSRAQRARWRAVLDEEHAGWGAATIYALLDADHRRAVDAVGRRCLGDAASVAGLELYFGAGMRPKRQAWRVLPEGLTFARATIDWKTFGTLFGKLGAMKIGVRTATLSRKLAASTNAALRSNVQFLTRSGWR